MTSPFAIHTDIIMLSHLIDLSLQNRFLVITLTLLMAVGGIVAAINLPIDAVPDMTNVQVTIMTDAGALSPVEVERYVTNPIEMTIGRAPRVEEVRSVSKFGISVVTLVFEEGTDIYWARQWSPNGSRAQRPRSSRIRHAGTRSADNSSGRDPAV